MKMKEKFSFLLQLSFSYKSREKFEAIVSICFNFHSCVLIFIKTFNLSIMGKANSVAQMYSVHIFT